MFWDKKTVGTATNPSAPPRPQAEITLGPGYGPIFTPASIDDSPLHLPESLIAL